MLYYLDSVYGSGSYDSSSYNGNASTSGNLLSNTGFDLTLIVTVACLVLCAALVVRVWKRKRPTPKTEA